jgi:hypothetical protein
MAELDLVPQALPMVAGDDDQRAVEKAFLLETVQDGPDVMVHIRDLAVVGTVGELFPVGRRGLVGEMGIVIMDPAEEPAGRCLVEPVCEPGEGLLGPALLVHGLQGLLGLERIVVNVEAAAEAEA